MRCTILLAATAIAAAGHAQDLIELAWQRRADGTIWIQVPQRSHDLRGPQPEAWQPMFPGLLSAKADPLDDVSGMRGAGPILLVPLLLCGDGGAAAHVDAARCRQLLGLQATLFGGPPEDDADPLLDLLRVRYLQGLDLLAATQQLGRYAASASDPFVRAAAAAGLRGRDASQLAAPAPAVPARDLAAARRRASSRLPARFDLLLGVDCAVMPSPDPLLDGMRQLGLRLGSEIALAAGGSVSPAQMLSLQQLIEAPRMLPFELASRFGNWRVDHALIARQGAGGGRWWCHLGGLFQPQRLANGLAQAGFIVHAEGKDGITAEVLGWRLVADAAALECWQEGFDATGAGTQAGEFAGRGAADAAPVWLHVPAGSALPAALGISPLRFDLELRTEPAGVSAVAECADEEAAGRLRSTFARWREQHVVDPDQAAIADIRWRDLDGLPPGCNELLRAQLAFSRRLQQVKCELQRAEVHWSFDASTLGMLELVQLYGAIGKAVGAR